MFLSLAQWLQAMSPDYGYLRVFQYLTFRAVMAALTALMIGLIAGPFVIRKLTQLKIGQPIRGYGVEAHLGRRTDIACYCLVHFAMGGFVQPICVDCVVGYFGLWGHRMGRRLAQSRAKRPRGNALWRKIPLAIHHWLAGCTLLGIQHFRGQQPACDGTFLQLGALRL